MLIDQMKSIKDNVKAILEEHAHLRDDDYRLIANYWYWQIGEEKFNQMSAQDLLDEFSKGNLAHSESIRRDRQKLQQQFPHLRGKKYEERQKSGQKTKEQIGDL